VDINPDNAAAWYAKGLALEVRGATKKAEECFRMAGSLNPIYEEKHRMQKSTPSKRSGRITATSMLGDVGADELEDIDVDMGR